MSIRPSELIKKVAGLSGKPIMLTGYVLTDNSIGEGIVRLYPDLDPRCYYEFEQDCIIHYILSEQENFERQVILLLDPECKVKIVTQRHVPAKQLRTERMGCSCQCDEKPDKDVPDVILAERDRFREQLIILARIAILLGTDEIDCTSFDSLSSTCCQTINRLLRAVKDGVGENEAAMTVMDCLGFGSG